MRRRKAVAHPSRRPALLCGRTPVRLCKFCDLDPWDDHGIGCVELLIRGRSRLPVEWPPGRLEELDLPDDTPCECGACIGTLHHYGCPQEACPSPAELHEDDCTGRLIECGCYCDGCDDHPPGPCTNLGDE